VVQEILVVPDYLELPVVLEVLVVQWRQLFHLLHRILLSDQDLLLI
jgi:hypothetical protein